MTCPTKRKGSDNWYFRRTIPAEVQRILAKLPPSKRPRNWYKTHVSISLGTADRDRAKAKCPEVAAAIERQMQALREGPKPLTVKQIAALSGEVYKAFAEGLEDDPVLSPAQWRDIAAGNREARDVNPLLFNPADPERRGERLERRYGKMADGILAKHALVTDAQSRLLLIERLSIDLPEASDKLARNADGDYSPDQYARRFPEWETKETNNSGTATISGLAEAWFAAALERGVKNRDAKRMKGIVLRFARWLGHDDLARVVQPDVARWADALVKDKKASTINKMDMPTLETVFKWGKERGWLATNPLSEGVRIQSRGRATTRDKFFSHDEATAILTAALAVKGGKREDAKTTAAKRWVPLLCAYSGARVSEMIQIRKEDVRREAGAWVVRLTPEAGSIKTNDARDVPVHEHLVALGFIRFVQNAPGGHLFCRTGPGGKAVEGSVEGVYSRIRKLVREVVPTADVAPLHAWRTTFKTRGIEVDIQEAVLDAICGHSSGPVGRRVYLRVTVAARIAAMRKFPRYDLALPQCTGTPLD